MNDEQWTKLTHYLAKELQDIRIEMRDGFAVLHKQDDKILTILDAIEKRLENDEQERLVMAHQLDRHDDWIHQLAHRIDHPLRVV